MLNRVIEPKLERELEEVTITLPRYIVVGIGGVAIGMAAMWCFTEVAGLYYLISDGLGAFLSISNDFIFNEIWTFSHRRRGKLFTTMMAKRFAKFIASKTVGFIIAISALAFLTQVIGFHYLVSNFFAIIASFIWNYTTSTFWVWARRK